MQNFKIMSFILLCAGSDKLFGMLQRKVSQAASSVATSLLLDSKRFLCGNQANDPMWLKVNHQIEEFHKKHGFDEIDAQKLDKIGFTLNYSVLYYLKKSAENSLFTLTYSWYPTEELENLIIKHGLDPAKVLIEVDNYEAIVIPTGAIVIGNTLVFGYRFIDNSLIFQIAAMEKLLGSMLCHDSEYSLFYRDKLSTDPDLAKEYMSLQHQRSDTHSALQSLENAKALFEGGINGTINEEERQKYLKELLAYMSKIK